MFERDWVLRAVKQLVDFIARALKLVDEQKKDEALETLQAACAATLDIEYRALAFLDAKSAVDLLGRPERGLAFGQLLEAMGEVEWRSGEPLRAEAQWRHALEFAEELLARQPHSKPALELAARLRSRVR